MHARRALTSHCYSIVGTDFCLAKQGTGINKLSYICKFANSPVYKFYNCQICTCAMVGLRSCKFTTFQVCQCTKLHICKLTELVNVQICKFVNLQILKIYKFGNLSNISTCKGVVFEISQFEVCRHRYNSLNASLCRFACSPMCKTAGLQICGIIYLRIWKHIHLQVWEFANLQISTKLESNDNWRPSPKNDKLWP